MEKNDEMPNVERRVAAYNRAKKRRPTEYTEYAELLKTEIDAAGIKTCDHPRP